jgi:hypothetical protein
MRIPVYKIVSDMETVFQQKLTEMWHPTAKWCCCFRNQREITKRARSCALFAPNDTRHVAEF